MGYQEFYCDSAAGNNMNGGSPIGGSYPLVYTNGGWNSGTGIFTLASGNPQSDGVTVGDYAAVFTDGGTTPAFIGQVTARNTTTITIDVSTRKIGTVPTTGASGLTCRVGGAWKGPNGTTLWPVGSVSNALTNNSSNPPRINFKSGTTYSVTASLTANKPGVTYQGYTTTIGDLGRATIDGGGSTITLWNLNGGDESVTADFIFANVNTGSSSLVSTVTALSPFILRCVAHGAQIGFNLSNYAPTLVECESYGNTTGVFCNSGTGFTMVRCTVHDNSGNGTNFGSSAAIGATFINCIFDTNNVGMVVTGAGSATILGCEFYNNASHGLDLSGDTAENLFIQDCNFIKNGGTAVKGNASSLTPTIVHNCGFGVGTQANGTDVSGRTVQQVGSVSYATGVTPWVDPANGDFRINLAAAKSVGSGTFTQTAASYAGTVGYPDRGAARHTDNVFSRGRAVNAGA